MNVLRAVISFALGGYFLWHACGPNAVQGNRAHFYGMFGIVLIMLGIWRLFVALKKSKIAA
jgi:hypothetical protein